MAKNSESDDRRQRLAEQLRANLQRRKAQARAKRAGEADARPEGLDAAQGEAGNGVPGGDGAEE